MHLPRFHPDMPSRFAVIPRRGGTDDIRWFEADPTFVLHLTNAYEDGDEIVLDGFFQGDPDPVDPHHRRQVRRRRSASSPSTGLQTRLHRWRFNLVTGETTEEQLSDSITEFGMINAGYAGRNYRYTYAATGKPGWFLFDGLVKHDLHDRHPSSGSRSATASTAARPRMAPRIGSTARGRRLPRHAHHRHDRRRLVLPGLRRRQGRRRAGVQAGPAGTDLQRNALHLGPGVRAATVA